MHHPQKNTLIFQFISHQHRKKIIISFKKLPYVSTIPSPFLPLMTSHLTTCTSKGRYIQTCNERAKEKNNIFHIRQIYANAIFLSFTSISMNVNLHAQDNNYCNFSSPTFYFHVFLSFYFFFFKYFKYLLRSNKQNVEIFPPSFYF